MNTQQELFVLLTIHQNNLKMLHWKACGKDFDTMHNIVTNNYYEKYTSVIDEVAEVMMRQSINPLTIMHCVVVATKNLNIKVIDHEKLYDRKDIIKYCDLILSDTCNAIEKVLTSEEMKLPKNVGIKSFYESLYDSFDKESRFLNKRRYEKDDI